MARYGTWVSYQGDGRGVLAIVLLLVAFLVALSGSRIRHPLPIPGLRRSRVGVLVAIWVAGLVAFVVGFSVYGRQEVHDYPTMTTPPTRSCR